MVLNQYCAVKLAGARGEGRRPVPIARAAKPLKRLKTAICAYWKNLAWIWIWRHVGLGWRRVGLGLAPRRLGIDGNHANRQRDKSHGLWDGVAKRLGGRGPTLVPGRTRPSRRE
jgi:hypothetical protein